MKYLKVVCNRIVSAILLLFLVTSSCTSKLGEAKMRKVVFNSKFQFLKPDGRLINVIDTVCIFNYKDIVIYKLPYFNLKEEMFFNYFVHYKNDDYGYLYTSLQADGYKKLSVDFVLTDKVKNKSELYSKNDHLLETKKNQGKYSLIQKYVAKTIPDYSYPDTSIFYYRDNLKEDDFSLSPILDKQNNSKVSKVRSIFNAQTYNGIAVRFPKREFIMEVYEDEVSVVQKNEILTLIEKFQSVSRPRANLLVIYQNQFQGIYYFAECD